MLKKIMYTTRVTSIIDFKEYKNNASSQQSKRNKFINPCPKSSVSPEVSSSTSCAVIPDCKLVGADSLFWAEFNECFFLISGIKLLPSA
jgi:hypothetical protein